MRRLNETHQSGDWAWVIDFCAQSLRNIVIGLGGRMDGYTMQSKFIITVGSELMAMLSIVRDLADLARENGQHHCGL